MKWTVSKVYNLTHQLVAAAKKLGYHATYKIAHTSSCYVTISYCPCDFCKKSPDFICSDCKAKSMNDVVIRVSTHQDCYEKCDYSISPYDMTYKQVKSVLVHNLLSLKCN